MPLVWGRFPRRPFLSLSLSLNPVPGARKAEQTAEKREKAEENLTEHETSYRDRAKQETERRKLATCTDFYSIVCFKTEDELNSK